MRTRRVTGFTLVEILIVVVILGILAAIVIPQFTSASQEAIKGALSSQLQTISSQVELYRVRNAGALPDNASETVPVGVAASETGWGVLVSQNYLKERPFNGFSGGTDLVIGTEADQVAVGTKPDASAGDPSWVYLDSSNGQYSGTVFAVGFDSTFLATETGYDPANTIPDPAAAPAP
jgi:general secretion pathway protein G